MSKNVKDLACWDQRLQERHEKNLRTFDKVFLAKQRQQAIDLENHKRKYFMLHKWEFIKEKRRQYELIVARMKQERTLKKRWAKLLHTHCVVKAVFGIYHAHQTEVKRR